jgi:hypothetical protein
MRARFLLFVGAFSLAGAASAVQACSSDETNTTSAGADSGPDAVAADGSPQKEPAAPEPDAAPCDLSADFSDEIPDASIADGATTTGLCLQCAHTSCQKQLAACNTECKCQQLAGQALGCFLQNSDKTQLELYQLCGGPLLGVDSHTQQLALEILSCLNDECPEDCATSAFQPHDAGTDADAN